MKYNWQIKVRKFKVVKHDVFIVCVSCKVIAIIRLINIAITLNNDCVYVCVYVHVPVHMCE